MEHLKCNLLASKSREKFRYLRDLLLFINATISYHNALCQKKLHKIPYHKSHDDTAYFNELQQVLGTKMGSYKDDYSFLIRHKNQADYGMELSYTLALQIKRRAEKIKQLVEPLL